MENITRKVQVFLYTRTPALKVLLLRRPPDQQGIWQPVTGTVEADDPSLEAAARRELHEETGVSSIAHLADSGYRFRFDAHGRRFEEYVWGAEAPSTVGVVLSAEHCEHRWATPAEALALIAWESNREGLRRVLAQAGLADGAADAPAE